MHLQILTWIFGYSFTITTQAALIFPYVFTVANWLTSQFLYTAARLIAISLKPESDHVTSQLNTIHQLPILPAINCSISIYKAL